MLLVLKRTDSMRRLILVTENKWRKYSQFYATILPAKSDSDIMFCLQSYQGFIIDRSLVF